MVPLIHTQSSNCAISGSSTNVPQGDSRAGAVRMRNSYGCGGMWAVSLCPTQIGSAPGCGVCAADFAHVVVLEGAHCVDLCIHSLVVANFDAHYKPDEFCKAKKLASKWNLHRTELYPASHGLCNRPQQPAAVYPVPLNPQAAFLGNVKNCPHAH